MPRKDGVPARGWVTKTVANLDSKEKPSPEEYADLREQLAEISKWLYSHRHKLGHAIIPDAGRHVQRQDVVDWVQWIAKEQVNGLGVWLDESEHGGEAATLMEALASADERIAAAEARAAEAEEAANQIAAQAKHAVVKTSGKAPSKAVATVEKQEDRGTVAKVTADASNAVVYDDDDD